MLQAREFLADHGIETRGDLAALALLLGTGALFGVITFAWFAGW